MSQQMNDLPKRRTDLMEISADIVCAYISHNTLSPTEVTRFIGDVHATLRSIDAGDEAAPINNKTPAT